MATLKEQMQKELNLPDDHFSTHESDLYVRSTDETRKWLRENHPYPNNIKGFSGTDGFLWLDIPFGYMEEDFARKFPNHVSGKNWPTI